MGKPTPAVYILILGLLISCHPVVPSETCKQQMSACLAKCDPESNALDQQPTRAKNQRVSITQCESACMTCRTTPAPPPATRADAWRPLFNGKNLDGWQPHIWKDRPTWQIDNGVIRSRGGKGYLRTVETFADFELVLEARVWGDGDHIFPPSKTLEFLDKKRQGTQRVHRNASIEATDLTAVRMPGDQPVDAGSDAQHQSDSVGQCSDEFLAGRP